MTETKYNAGQLSMAVFITPHGFGHAARAAAVMLELRQMIPELIFHIYTKVPQWFFVNSHLSGFVYHDLLTDIGLAQRNAFEEDLDGTILRLQDFYPLEDQHIQALAGQILAHGCRLVLCDIAPLGIAVARRAGIPSILQENFTWDWIYSGYPTYRKQFEPFIRIMAGWFSQADHHFQTTPACREDARWTPVAPVYRAVQRSRAEIRQDLHIDENPPTVLVTMGGIESQFQSRAAMKMHKDTVFILPGASSHTQWDENLLCLPYHHGIYHPDLVNACDAVIGKLGYSTLAECYAAGAPFGYIPRKQFPESAPLADFIQSNMQGAAISEEDFQSGRWLVSLPEILARPVEKTGRANGARQIARFIRELLSR